MHDIASVNAAIYLDGAQNTTVQGNLVYAVTGNDGIKFGDKLGSSTDLSGGQAIDNIIHDTAQDGISVYMSNVIVDGNDIAGSNSVNGAIFVEFDVNNVAITDNTIHDNGSDADGHVTYAIRIGKDDQPTDVTVSGNTFAGNEAQLIIVAGATFADGATLADILAGNTFDAGAAYASGFIIYSSLAEAEANAPADATILVAGEYGVAKYDAQIAHAARKWAAAPTFHRGAAQLDVNFTITDNPSAGIEAALRAKLRYNGDLDPDGSTYYAETGISSGTAGLWNFDYSVIDYGDNPDIDNYNIQITVDFVALDGTRTSGIMTFDPLDHLATHPDEAYYQDATNNTDGVQNSQNIGWYYPGFDASASGTYELTLTVTISFRRGLARRRRRSSRRHHRRQHGDPDQRRQPKTSISAAVADAIRRRHPG